MQFAAQQSKQPMPMTLQAIFKKFRTGCGTLFIPLFTCTFFSCGEEEKTPTVDTSYKSPVKSAKIIDEIHARKFTQDSDHPAMADLNLSKIEEIRTYCNVERWNSGADVESRHSTHYEPIAKALNLPASKLKAAESYYSSAIMRPLDSIIKAMYSKSPGIEIDYYRPLQSTAYCGMHTIITELIVYQGADRKEILEQAAVQATEMIASLPDWIDGIKFNGIRRKDTVLQTSDDMEAGFIWRRGEALKPMPGSRSGFGRMPAAKCTVWYNNEWNDQKTIKHSAYEFLKPVAVAGYVNF